MECLACKEQITERAMLLPAQFGIGLSKRYEFACDHCGFVQQYKVLRYCTAKQLTHFGMVCGEALIKVDGEWRHLNPNNQSYDHEAVP